LKKTIYIISIISFILDQLTKYLVINFISFNETITIIPKFFYLTYVKNTGGAFSILNNNTWFLLLIGLICIFFLFNYIIKKEKFNSLEKIYLGLIIGGTLGNLIDRITYGSVIDYIGVIIGSYYFPVFNIADICIVIGAILLIIDSIKGDKNEYRSKSR